MDDLKKLEEIELISKVCTELNNHINVNDEVLAKYVIHLAYKHNLTRFREKLRNNDANWADSFTQNLHSLVRRMKKKNTNKGKKVHISKEEKKEINNKKNFPALCQPDNVEKANLLLNSVDDENERLLEDKTTDDMMYQLEGLIKSTKEFDQQSPLPQKEKGRIENSRRHRSRSPKKRSKHHRSRSPMNKKYKRQKRSRSPHYRKSNRYSQSPDRRKKSYDRNDRNMYKKKQKLLENPEEGSIYDGIVTKLMNFGCFVQLNDFSRRLEGLVHISELKQEGRVHEVSEVVSVRQKVKVKVLTISNITKDGRPQLKISLTLKDVDQNTGEDLNPSRNKGRVEIKNNPSTSVFGQNPDMPGDFSTDYLEMHTSNLIKKTTKISDHELFEIRQMEAAGCLAPTERPDFDTETGLLPRVDSDDEDLEIDLVDEDPPFLNGQAKQILDLEPVKIVKNPDGSLTKAAMMQGALAKERREEKQKQREAEQEGKAKPMGKSWNDPLPELDRTGNQSEAKKSNSLNSEQPEWKKHVFGGHKASLGKKTNLSILEQRNSLPIYKLKKELLEAVEENQILIVIGETGSGKTTQITQYLAEEGYTLKGKIGCTQPRRVAAMSVATRVAEEFGCNIGQEVGYSIRFEDRTSQETKIKYMTEGMMLRECLVDFDLSQYSVIMLDEAHERTINTDVLFGLLKKAVCKRPELKLIVTSATLNAAKFSEYFNEAPIFTIPGRAFPVEVMYAKEPEQDYLDASLVTVMQIHLTEPPGDILLFLTGQEEIDTSCEILFERMKNLGSGAPELIILPVYSALPSEMQTKIFEPAPPGSRKVVIATNIAETSLTIDGIYYVVDPGFVKQKVYNSKNGIDQLVVTPISQAQATQRTGRAGRTGPGKCYRLYTERAFRDEMLETPVPELQRTNLTSTVLNLKAMGINDLISFDFMDKPPMQTLVTAMEQLYHISALDDEGLLTRLGRRMAEFPLEPMLSKMLIMSVHLGCSDEIVTIVSMLSQPNVFYRPKEKQAVADQKKAKFHQSEGDLLTLLSVYNSWKNNKFSNYWCFENFVQARTLKRAQDVRKQMLGIMDRHKLDIISAGNKNTAKIQKAICSGYFRNAAKKDPQEGYRTLLDQQIVYVHPSSSLFHRQPEWVVYHELVLTTKEYMRDVTAVDARWLVEFAPKFFKTGDPTKLSKQKKNMKLEPLYNRYEEPNSWRISRAYRRR